MFDKRFFINLMVVLTLSSAGSYVTVAAADTALDAALTASIRGDDNERDASRKPAETLAFFEVSSGSSVLELMPGSGWYTKILGTYLKDSGELYLAINVREERLKLDENNLQHVKIIGKPADLVRTDDPTKLGAGADEIDFGVTNIDVALTFRNLHNMTEAARGAVNRAVFRALKPGGVFGMIDHTRRHMEVYDEERWRRMDPVQIIKEAVAAGFIFEDYSDLHSRPADELIYDSTDDSIEGDSDRFTLKFRKP